MHSFYLPSGNLEALVVNGPDAERLLQGQLTCDVAAVPEPGFTRAAICNNKGRALGTFILVRHGAAFYLIMHQGLGTVVTAALKKYLPFYKCELSTLPAPQACIGIAGDKTAGDFGLEVRALPANGQCASLEEGWICNLDQERQRYLVCFRGNWEAPATAEAGTLSEWLIQGLHAGEYPFLAVDTEKFTPQELLLDRHGYVSFTKGCYTGQEIVARMHYRGKLKKLLFLLEGPADATPIPEPMEVLDGNGQVLGSTLRVLNHSGVLYALASLPADWEEAQPATVRNRAGLLFSARVF